MFSILTTAKSARITCFDILEKSSKFEIYYAVCAIARIHARLYPQEHYLMKIPENQLSVSERYAFVFTKDYLASIIDLQEVSPNSSFFLFEGTHTYSHISRPMSTFFTGKYFIYLFPILKPGDRGWAYVAFIYWTDVGSFEFARQ